MRTLINISLTKLDRIEYIIQILHLNTEYAQLMKLFMLAEFSQIILHLKNL
jgi:hypothetical protein